MQINVSIVTYCNQLKQLTNIVTDILNSSDVVLNRLYIIDNSPNSLLSQLTGLNTKIKYIHCPQNLGYGTAHNIGINESIKQDIDYHLVVNPDIRIEPLVLSQLVTYMESDKNIGMVMPDIRYPDGSRQYLCKLLPTPLSLFSRRFLPRFISNKFDTKYNLLNANYNEEMNVPVLSGCFMFLRTSVIKEVGGFDPGFFLYLEDFDFVRRIHIKYKTVYYPKVQVTHEFAKGSYKSRKLMVCHIESAIKYFNKWGWLFDFERFKINALFLKAYYPRKSKIISTSQR